MGGESKNTTTQQSSTVPWTAAMPEVNGLLSQLSGLIPNSGATSATTQAINQLTANGQAGNPYAPAVGNVATNLLNGGGATSEAPMVNANLASYRSELAPYLSSDYSTINSPAVQAALSQIGTDTTNNINSQFAAAGRSGSGMNAQTVARGVAQAEAPLILSQANQDTATRLGAANSLYNAGNTTANTVAGYNQQGASNMLQGIPAANSALTANNWGPQSVIQAQELGQSIPAQNLGLLANIGIPLAELGRSSNGTSQTTYDPSLLSEISGIGGLFSGGANSAFNGVSKAGAGLLSGLTGLLSL